MDFPNQNGQPTEQGSAPDREVTTSSSPATSTKVLGVERRLIGFGFGLFLTLLILAMLYTVYTQDQSVTQVSAPRTTPTTGSMTTTPVLPTTPDTVVDDLVDEALADSDDMDALDADEVSDIEDGSNN